MNTLPNSLNLWLIIPVHMNKFIWEWLCLVRMILCQEICPIFAPVDLNPTDPAPLHPDYTPPPPHFLASKSLPPPTMDPPRLLLLREPPSLDSSLTAVSLCLPRPALLPCLRRLPSPDPPLPPPTVGPPPP